MQLLISFGFVPPVILAFVYLLNLALPLMPLYLSAFNFSAQMVMIFTYPSLIAPLFNKYSPLPEGSLRDGIEALASELAFLFLFPAAPLAHHGRLQPHRPRAHIHVVALVARELGHWKLGHRWLSMAAAAVAIGSGAWRRCMATVFLKFALFAVVRSSPHLLAAFGFRTDRPAIVALSLFAMILKPLDKLLLWRSFRQTSSGRRVQLGRALGLQTALKAMHQGNEGDFVVNRLYSHYHHSHPPLAERLRAIQVAAKTGA
eukprot:jgi/Ulvmu1/791/UM010_0165.1